ncbi:MAG: efflux RND transporter permease subunit [Firmicutes bacterium]|nr:efflux RND transporter permease subunit [Bacillota bacterium]
MKKVAGCIVKGRMVILAVFAALTVICGILISQVKLNYDMSQYLPKDSGTRIGTNLMSDEFPQMSTLNVMLSGLSEEEKARVYQELSAKEHITSVGYDAQSEQHNRDGYSLYTLQLDVGAYADASRALVSELGEEYEGFDIAISGEAAMNVSMGVLPLLFGVAAAILFVILFLMCNSWLEPFLILLTIGTAIVLNMGTNIVFDSVSDITMAIGAILQLVLSIDYSIMLLNRFRQEKRTTPDIREAMKNTIRQSFTAISSSAATTIVGMLALVFMRFMIGRDIGFVLAKGVFFSLLCIFTVLPGLVLLSNTAIEKSEKKYLRFNMEKLGRFSYKARIAIPIAFVLLFAGSFILRDKVQIDYTMEKYNDVGKVFTPDNPIVVLYENGDEDKIAALAGAWEKDPQIDSVNSYATTLQKKMSAEDMAAYIASMGGGMKLDAQLLNIVYYAVNSTETPALMTPAAFLHFIAADVAENPAFAAFLDEEMRANLEQMKTFADKDSLTAPMAAKELAALLGQEPGDVAQLYALYFAQKGGVETGTMTLPAFACLANDMAGDEAYAAMMDKDMLAEAETLAVLADLKKAAAPRGYTETAKLLGLDANDAKLLFAVCYASKDDYQPGAMTATAFAGFLRDKVAGNPLFAGVMDEAALSQVGTLAAFTDKNVFQKQMDSEELAALFGVESRMVRQAFTLRFGLIGLGARTMSPQEFVRYLLTDVADNILFRPYLDDGTIKQLNIALAMMEAALAGEKLGYGEMAELLGMDAGQAKTLYVVYAAQRGAAAGWKLSLREAVTTMAESADDFSGFMSAEQLAQLQTARRIMDGAANGTRYTAKEMAGLTGMDAAQARQLYLFYASQHGDTDGWALSVRDFLQFICSDILPNNAFSGRFDAKTRAQLQAANHIAAAVLSEKVYGPAGMGKLLSGFSEDLDSGTVELLYAYHAALEKSDPAWALSMEELFEYLSDHMPENAAITEGKEQLEDGKKLLRGSDHSRVILNTKLPEEGEDTFAFVQRLESELDGAGIGTYYLVGNSIMAHEMRQSYPHEIKFITILTAAAIFIVVLLAFRSLGAPLILVCLIQCAVFIVMSSLYLAKMSVYYLPLLIVQCLLMGAAIDYGILLTSYYREARQTMDRKEAVIAALNHAIHTVLTSGLILTVVTFVLGLMFLSSQQAIAEILLTIAGGAVCSTLLVVFFLPGILVALDRLVVKKAKKKGFHP